MGGDDSQKLLPWRGILSSPGRKPPAPYEINTVTKTAPRFARLPAELWLSYKLPGSFLASTGGSVLARAEGRAHLSPGRHKFSTLPQPIPTPHPRGAFRMRCCAKRRAISAAPSAQCGNACSNGVPCVETAIRRRGVRWRLLGESCVKRVAGRMPWLSSSRVLRRSRMCPLRIRIGWRRSHCWQHCEPGEISYLRYFTPSQ
jgi:hypothetical protein